MHKVSILDGNVRVGGSKWILFEWYQRQTKIYVSEIIHLTKIEYANPLGSTPKERADEFKKSLPLQRRP